MGYAISIPLAWCIPAAAAVIPQHSGIPCILYRASGPGHPVYGSQPNRKSTQASLWEKYRGARILNGDKAGVQPGEMTTVHGMPFCGTSGICENVSLPLRCIVVLSLAKENTARRLGVREALPLLSPNVFADQLIAEEWQKTLMLLLDLVENVPIYSLACTPDVRAVEALEQATAQDGLTNHH